MLGWYRTIIGMNSKNRYQYLQVLFNRVRLLSDQVPRSFYEEQRFRTSGRSWKKTTLKSVNTFLSFYYKILNASFCLQVKLSKGSDLSPLNSVLLKEVETWLEKGNYIIKELEALYMLKKYRTLKRRYYPEEM